MQPDPALIQDTRAWMPRASRDIQAAEHDLRAEPPLLDAAVFHCRQAAEKALKALLTWHDVPSRRTHNLTEIGEACAGIDAGLEELSGRVGPLTRYAWLYRYPGDAEQPRRGRD